ncbi:AEC family transporter [Sinisalibacter aestuarii]|uniref:Malonate transporter n=1 Tax=Sinisalibacter aestuarii TaxID=2949426 RepID=A0ABQ5LSZ3_9RHOB|nr:AEC family transporter [Sinisalibacter aestuarii]GKY88112.1 malonate transporter [Sinisalibacter aestuarii]
MSALIEVILPVFLVIGFGYGANKLLKVDSALFEYLMKYAQAFAFPVLLFRGISRLHLGETFDPMMLTAFYTGVTLSFVAGLLGAHYLFRRPWPDSVAVAFATAFSNGGLLGLPITERAYGADALGYNFAIIAFHAPFVYMLSVTAMEIVRAGGRSAGATMLSVARSMIRNPFIIGIGSGALFNASGLPMPAPVASTIDMVAASAIPAALFALGGILAAYRPEGDLKLVIWISAISLLFHPAVVWLLSHGFALGTGPTRSAVLMASMAPGVNAYVFANMYGTAKRTAATAVLVGTAASIVTVWGWLWVLG